jgi:hypothetical protein
VKCSKASYSPFSFLFPQVSSSYFLIDYSLEHLIRLLGLLIDGLEKGLGLMYASKALFILIPMADSHVQKDLLSPILCDLLDDFWPTSDKIEVPPC